MSRKKVAPAISLRSQLGIYQHFKGETVEVIAFARHSETLEEIVVYKTLYENRTYGKGSVWMRSLSMFTEAVEVGGRKVQRFRLVRENS
ncbi:DUF1653 domain-containing protein [Candidatus Uhrbacteria bacterium]|nr:DUF1653 domain-containing protein [Candidatus Uhrbacteria bacterium]